MKLYLHIGTEKTGSSFIQTSFAGNRDHLLANGIWYPTAGAREGDMLAGRISPGNALELFRALRREDADAVTSILKSWREQGERKQAQAVLISNENLIEAFARPTAFAQFLNLLETVGFTEPSLLLMLRDPVDQALSLYKHRAKNGGIAPLEEWLSTAYHLGSYLKSFRAVIAAHPGLIAIKRYAKGSTKLLHAFYEEWLGITPPSAIEHTRVNPSLTLSELMLLNQLHERNPLLARQFYANMLAVSPDDKSKDEFLIGQVRQKITNTLIADRPIWSAYNELLPPNDQLMLPGTGGEAISPENVFSFSETQLGAMADYFVDTHQASAIWQRKLDQLKILYGKIVRR